ncbi:hypothetical protein GQR58_023517 [Nymphon striatum]|nr:hypothetical protein GQR58_023517 [Nymphon striatum]
MMRQNTGEPRRKTWLHQQIGLAIEFARLVRYSLLSPPEIFTLLVFILHRWLLSNKMRKIMEIHHDLGISFSALNKRFFCNKWRKEYLVLFKDSRLLWYKEKEKNPPAGGLIVSESPGMIAIGVYTARVPNRPDIPDGFSLNQLIALGTKDKHKVYWFLCKSEEEASIPAFHRLPIGSIVYGMLCYVADGLSLIDKSRFGVGEDYHLFQRTNRTLGGKGVKGRVRFFCFMKIFDYSILLLLNVTADDHIDLLLNVKRLTLYESHSEVELECGRSGRLTHNITKRQLIKELQREEYFLMLILKILIQMHSWELPPPPGFPDTRLSSECIHSKGNICQLCDKQNAKLTHYYLVTWLLSMLNFGIVNSKALEIATPSEECANGTIDVKSKTDHTGTAFATGVLIGGAMACALGWGTGVGWGFGCGFGYDYNDMALDIFPSVAGDPGINLQHHSYMTHDAHDFDCGDDVDIGGCDFGGILTRTWMDPVEYKYVYVGLGIRIFGRRNLVVTFSEFKDKNNEKFMYAEIKFSATSHGKGIIDGIGGRAKYLVRHKVMSKSSTPLIIQNSQDFANAANQLMEKTTNNYLQNSQKYLDLLKQTDFLYSSGSHTSSVLIWSILTDWSHKDCEYIQAADLSKGVGHVKELIGGTHLSPKLVYECDFIQNLDNKFPREIQTTSSMKAVPKPNFNFKRKEEKKKKEREKRERKKERKMRYDITNMSHA